MNRIVTGNKLNAYTGSHTSVYDVARLAGVSAATVSRVMNRPGLVSSKTQVKVSQAMQRLGFVPNVNAQALSRGDSKMIGVLLPHLGYSIYSEYLSQLQKTARENGYEIVIGVHHFDNEDELHQVQQLARLGVAAVILLGFAHDERLFDFLQGRKMRYLCTDVYNPQSPHPHVGYDNHEAGWMLADYLYGLGHRSFAAVMGELDNNDRMAARLEGFRDRLAKDGLVFVKNRLVQVPQTIEGARAGFVRLWRGDGGVASQEGAISAIMCGDDVMGIGVLSQAR